MTEGKSRSGGVRSCNRLLVTQKRVFSGYHVNHIRRVVEGDLPAATEAAKGVHERTLGGLDGEEADRAVVAEVGFKLLGRGGGKFEEKLPPETERHPGKRVEEFVQADLTEHRAEVGPVELRQVFKINEVRQGWPPDRWGREE